MAIFDKERRAARRALYAEADRRGVSVEQLREVMTTKELAHVIETGQEQPDFARWGLPPRDELVDTESTGVPAVDAAVTAAAGNDWRPAATLLAESDGDWHLRSCAAEALGRVAADDDGWLAAWRAAEPDDANVLVVDCAARVALAWQLRGGGRGADTTARQAADFARVLAEAEEVAGQAVTALPDDPTPLATLLTIGRGRGYSHHDFLAVWQQLVERAPLHRRGHESALQYWTATWHGSHDTTLGFAQRAADRSPSLNVLLLQAAHVVGGGAWRRNDVRTALDTHLYWLANDGAHGVDLRDDLGWAAMALVETGRYDEAVACFRLLGTDAGGAPWRSWSSPAKQFNEYRKRACAKAAA